MTELASITVTERKLISESWRPDLPWGGMNPHAMQMLTETMWECSAPLASYALNRVAAWLDGKVPFKGDETFDVAWEGSPAPATTVFSKKGRSPVHPRTCTLTRREDGATWVVTWSSAKYRDVPEISLSLIDASGQKLDIVRGEITSGEPGSGNRHRFSNCPPPIKGTVEADIEYGAFNDLRDFCDAIRGSLPEGHLAVPFESAVTFAHLSRLQGLEKILTADGGLPGRICALRHILCAKVANTVAGAWMRDKYVPLIAGLRERGAEWGKGALSYNDSDYRCCLVDFADGSIGLFSDNTASCADEHAYVARLETDGDAVKSVAVHVVGKDEDYQAKIDAIGAGDSQPDYTYDYEFCQTSFPGGRMGWIGMTMFLWQSMADSTYALKDGRLDEDCSYWRSGDAPAVPG
jgi:hypothetical protein